MMIGYDIVRTLTRLGSFHNRTFRLISEGKTSAIMLWTETEKDDELEHCIPLSELLLRFFSIRRRWTAGLRTERKRDIYLITNLFIVLFIFIFGYFFYI